LLAHPTPASAGYVRTLLLRRVQSFFEADVALRLPAIRRLRISLIKRWESSRFEPSEICSKRQISIIRFTQS
jgi:hypothetical protein